MPVRFSWLPLVALLASLSFASSASAALLTANGVDSALGGTMTFTSYVPDFNGGMIHLTAKNTSATNTYQGVALAVEFIYPTNSSNPFQPIANGFNYSGGALWSGP